MALSFEPLEKIKKELVEARQAKFWIGADPEGESWKYFGEGEQMSFPKFFLVDSKGQVVGNAIPDSRQLERLLAKVFLLKLGRDLHLKLGKAKQAYDRGAYGLAHKLASPLQKHKDAELAKDAKFLCDRIESYASFSQTQFDAERVMLSPLESYARLLILRYQFEAPKLDAWFQNQAKQLKKRKDIRKLRRSWIRFEAALASKFRYRFNDKSRAKSRQKYLMVFRKDSGIIKQLARERGRRL